MCTMNSFPQKLSSMTHVHPKNTSRLLDLPLEVLRRIMLFTFEAGNVSPPFDATRSAYCTEHCREPFLDASSPMALQNGLRLALTCHTMNSVFQDALTAVVLISSWQVEQNTLVAACKLAAQNLRALHIECSAPVTTALKEVISSKPPVRHLVLIGVNISEKLMSDIIFFVGPSLEKLVISAAPSLNDVVVDLMSQKCDSLTNVELGGSRRVSSTSLVRLFTNIGNNLRGIDINSLYHESFDDDLLFTVGKHCVKLKCFRLAKLGWVTDVGIETLFKQRGHQITEVRIVDCQQVSLNSVSVLSNCNALLEKLHFSDHDGSSNRAHRHREWGHISSSEGEIEPRGNEHGKYLNEEEKALVQLSHKSRRLRSLTLSNRNVSDLALNSISQATGKTLRYLDVRSCTSLGNETLFSLAKYCLSLKFLDISYLRAVEDRAFEELLRALQGSLEEVRITGCTGLTNETIQTTIPRFGKGLRIIRLSYCNFSMSAVAFLRQALPRLTLVGSSPGPIR